MTPRKTIDDFFMQECFNLATKGIGRTSPNPNVGAVLVKDGKVIGRGYHASYGAPHAEIVAISDCMKNGESPSGAHLYVNLEPCSHHGKTPPCVDSIIANKIHSVVIAMEDPNPLIAGNGIRKLRAAGIAVKIGVLRTEAMSFNESFIKYIATGLPFVLLKVAETADGYLAQINGVSRWISSQESRLTVHRFRSQYDVVLVGAHTVKVDNPRLTVRQVEGRNPTRVILDGNLRIHLSAHVVADACRKQTFIYSREDADARKVEALTSRGVTVVKLPADQSGKLLIRTVIADLGARGFASVMVEGGANTFHSFLSGQCADKIIRFVSTKHFGKGIPTFPDQHAGYRIRLVSLQKTGTDQMRTGYVSYLAND